MRRRELLKFGMYGFGGVSLSQLLRARASADDVVAEPGAGRRTAKNRHGERTAIILVWQRGGCSHLDTWDPKPDAPTEFRGPYSTCLLYTSPSPRD